MPQNVVIDEIRRFWELNFQLIRRDRAIRREITDDAGRLVTGDVEHRSLCLWPRRRQPAQVPLGGGDVERTVRRPADVIAAAQMKRKDRLPAPAQRLYRGRT